jgi:hypothetical protein
MSPTQAIYLVNVLICAILALLMTNYWRRSDREPSLGTFMASAWVLLVADIVFYLRDDLAYWAGRSIPTVLVTVGQVFLLVGARRLVGRSDAAKRMIALVVVHTIILAGFLIFLGGVSSLRTALNGTLWALLSFAAASVLRGAKDDDVREAMSMPALVFALHGAFHVLRVTFALLTWTGVRSGTPVWLQIAGDMEVSAFMVGLFLALLVGYAQLRGARLLKAERELRELTTLLPICAWCKNVRSDEGYWQKIEDYFASRADVRVTHGMCDSCSREALKEG